MSEEKRLFDWEPILTAEQIQTFKKDGVLVIPNVLSQQEIEQTKQGFEATLSKLGVNMRMLGTTAHKLTDWGVVGGIVSFFYPEWKMKVIENQKMYQMMVEIYASTYASGSDKYFRNPFAPFNPNHLYAYIDRVNFRLPQTYLDEAKIDRNAVLKQNRGLIPHVDSHPFKLYDFTINDFKDFGFAQGKQRWRPIQSFISLTDNLEADQGGFEALPGFHKEFEKYFSTGPGSRLANRAAQHEFNQLQRETFPDIAEKMRSIPYAAGSAVLWDWRIVHCNSQTHNGSEPRQVIYNGYMPDIPINRMYAAHQLYCYNRKLVPPDFSGHSPEMRYRDMAEAAAAKKMTMPCIAESPFFKMFDVTAKEKGQAQRSELGQRLLGLTPWIDDDEHKMIIKANSK